MRKIAYQGNDWIGMFAESNNDYTIVPVDSSGSFTEKIEEILKTECIQTTIGETNLVGIYTVMNSNGIILPNIATQEEVKILKKTGLNIYISKDNHNANGNNILVNDKGGLIHPGISKEEKLKIQDVLGVELESRKISDYTTVGSSGLVNNRGFLLNFKTSEEELKELEEIFKVKGMRGTINLGTGFVSIGAIVNDKSYLVGRITTAHEMGRIEESLDYLDG